MELKLADTLTSLELLEQINIFRQQDGNKSDLEHKNLLSVIRDEFEEEIDELKIQPISYKDSMNREKPMFILTLSQAKQVLVRESKFVRKAVIQYIEKLEKKLQDPMSVYEGKSKWDIIMLHAEAEKEKERLSLELKVAQPKVEYHDKVLSPSGLVTTTDIAKDLSMSAIALNKRLNEAKIIYKQSKNWKFYSEHEDKVPEYADYHITEFGQNLKWTEKGRRWIINMVENGYI